MLWCEASVTRASVLAERWRVLLYQVISLSEKLLKGFPPMFWLPEWGEWDAQQDPPFSRVLDILRKSLCTILAVMAKAVEDWCCLFSLVSQGLLLCGGSWEGVWEGGRGEVGRWMRQGGKRLEQRGHQGTFWHSQSTQAITPLCPAQRLLKQCPWHLHQKYIYLIKPQSELSSLWTKARLEMCLLD